ncbi:MAG: RNA-binding domain-containing protein [Thermoplasmata archaeon]
MQVEVKAPCNPTEDVSRVERAMKRIFPDLDVREKGGYLIGTGSSVEKFIEILKNQRIRSAARGVFLASRSTDEISFALNKQVAFVGKVSFGSGSPLGDIEVSIVSDDIDSVIDSMAPDLGDSG